MEGGMIKINGGRSFRQRHSGRPIPKRGQVKLAIFLGLANSVACIFSRTASCAAPPQLAR